ncbi:hypothetical protein ERE07_14695 [Allopusillimonas ginsengisoli]|nr:hypothetical protein ERE07_14695 [Allopusillimonas ginsengisoli]
MQRAWLPGSHPTTPPRTEACPEPTAQPASLETALVHTANIRKMLNAPTNAGEIAAQPQPPASARQR